MLPRILFMGSPEFALPSLRSLAERYPLVGVVTQPDRPAGRGRELAPPPVKSLALALGLPIIQPERLRAPEAMEQLHAWSPDLIVVAAFGQILRTEVLDLPPLGCVNVHASLLPRWRGAAPIQAAILHGDAETGVSIMRMDAGIDTGGVFSQLALPIAPGETAGAVSARLSEAGAALLLATLPAILEGAALPTPQDESQATYAPMLKKEDGALDFTQPAESLARRVRAFNPWPAAYTLWKGQPLKVLRARAVPGAVAPGVAAVHQGLPAVGCAAGLLLLEELQPAGKKPMPGGDFLRGARDWAGVSL